MRIQLSSGNGPAECELAVGLLYEALKKEADDIRLLSSVPGKKRDCYSSIQFETCHDFTGLEGTILWICKSPFRPNHKRKNWYVDFSILEEVPRITEDALVRFETFRSGGKGGQNVNKVETGVRVIHLATGISVVSTEARTQHQNKQIAMNRLCDILAEINRVNQSQEKNLAWLEHTRLERGNPVRIYEGIHFKRK